MRFSCWFILLITILSVSFSKQVQAQKKSELRVFCPIKDPKARDLRNRAKEKMDKEKYAKAIKLFEKCLAIDTMSCDSWDELGVCYRRIGRTDDAIRCYTRSLHINRENPVPAMNLGFLYLLKRDYPSAANAYTICISIDSTNPEGYFGVASAAHYLAPDSAAELTYVNIGKAMQRYQKYTRSVPQDVRLLAGKIAYHAGHYDVARIQLGMINDFQLLLSSPSYFYYKGLLDLKETPPNKAAAKSSFAAAKELGYPVSEELLRQTEE